MPTNKVLIGLLSHSLLLVAVSEHPPAFDAPRTCKGFEKEVDICDTQKPCRQCIPINCEFDDWTEWFRENGCVGLCTRHRGIRQVNNECGKPCDGDKLETKKCAADIGCQRNKTDCMFSQWSEWGMYDANCIAKGLGQRFSTRTIVAQATFGGRACTGSLNRTKPCGGPPRQDCVLSAWGPFTVCSASCDGGYKAQMRRILTPAKGGSACSADLRRTEPCNTQPCKVPANCTASTWSDWTGCDGTVGKDAFQKYRHRKMLTPQVGLGNCNLTLEETEGCHFKKPPQDCVLTTWADWEGCDMSCGGGQKFRSRQIASYPVHGGGCPHSGLVEVIACNSIPCPREGDCIMGEWSAWLPCSKACGLGETYRVRHVLEEASPGFQGCTGATKEAKACVIQPCNKTKQDCVWDDWEDWSGCSCTCGGGTMRRQRMVKISPRNGGKRCDTMVKDQIAPCATQACVPCVNGTWAAWSEWSSCSATCDSGYKFRHRDVASFPNICGLPAVGVGDQYEKCTHMDPSTKRPRTCVEDKDCLVSPWKEWSSCSCSCFGIQSKSRDIIQWPRGLGRTCNDLPLKVTQQCHPSIGEGVPPDCGLRPAPCKFTQWTGWEECPVTCGGAETFRTRQFSKSMVDGLPCTGNLQEYKACKTHSCSMKCIDCKWGSWGEWGACGNECTSQKYRWRHIETMPNICGMKCTGGVGKETAKCPNKCGAKFCAWTDWVSITECGTHCGTQTMLRKRTLGIFGQEQLGGSSQPDQSKYLIQGDSDEKGTSLFQCAGSIVEQKGCGADFQPCFHQQARDCEFAPWSSWSAPTFARLCERHRIIMIMNEHGGKPCAGPQEETKLCLQERPVEDDPCGEWTPWNGCGGPTYQNFRSRTPGVLGRKACKGVVNETASCAPPPETPIDCKVAPWAEWSLCSATCEGGTTTREREIGRRAMYGGKSCAKQVLAEIKECNTMPCEEGIVNCEFTDWYVDGSSPHCPGNCTNQQGTKRRSVKIPATKGGEACNGPLVEIFPCKEKVDCMVSEWSTWDKCDRTCGGGTRARHRQVLENPKDGGKACPPILIEVMGCNDDPCERADCKLAAWSGWSTCSTSGNVDECGDTGQTLRSRQIAQMAQGGGLGCEGPMLETEECKRTIPDSCTPRDCEWGDWHEWSQCTCECDGGQKERSRQISVYPTKGGKICEAMSKHEIVPCNTQECSKPECVDGLWDTWEDWTVCSATCGEAIKTRYRKMLREANSCGKVASGMSHEVAECYLDHPRPCQKSKPCVFGQWNEWSGCTTTCNGVKRRERVIIQQGQGEGKWCVGPVKVTEPCGSCPETPPEDCKMSDWFSWGTCSATCGEGVATRSRMIIMPPSNGGKHCPPVLAEVGRCKDRDCIAHCKPKDCVWGSWNEWSACDKCGGQKRRFRRPLSYPSCGGTPCDYMASEYVEKCDRHCHEKTYCAWAVWDMWTNCSALCGVGTRTRFRHLEVLSVDAVRTKITAMNTTVLEDLGFDAELLGSDLNDLKEQAAKLEGRRIQEMVVAFGAGLSCIVVGAVILRMIPRVRSKTDDRDLGVHRESYSGFPREPRMPL